MSFVDVVLSCVMLGRGVVVLKCGVFCVVVIVLNSVLDRVLFQLESELTGAETVVFDCTTFDCIVLLCCSVVLLL